MGAVAADARGGAVQGSRGVHQALRTRTSPLAESKQPLASATPPYRSLLVSAADRVGQHIDRRLFNIVVGTAADLAPIHMHVGGDSAGALACMAGLCAGMRREAVPEG